VVRLTLRNTAPYVHKYQSVEKFLQSPYQETRDVDIAASSALGSAALAWDISVALEKPVLAIVPGYGVDWVTRKATLPGYPPSNSKSSISKHMSHELARLELAESRRIVPVGTDSPGRGHRPW
jgi:hypothetical protein